MLIVSHDRYFVNKLASRILELTPNGVKEYLGNYDEYIEKKEQLSAPEAEKTAKQPKKVNEYKLRKEQASNLRKAKTRLKKCEEEIDALESDIENINSRLAESDYEELMKLTAELDEKTARRDTLYSEWEELSEFLSENEEV